MSSCSQKSRLATESKQSSAWAKMFPSKVDTEAKSCLLIKKLVSVAVSNICYARDLFPEEAFANKTLEKLPLKILKEKNTNAEARQLANYLVAVFDSIEKKYLKEFIMTIYEDPASPLSALEVYSFWLSYPGSGIACQVGLQGKKNLSISMETVKESTQSLLKRLLEMTKDLPPIPEETYLAVRLTYYDEVTPIDYHPEGFVHTEYEMPRGRAGASTGHVGNVTTEHHSLTTSMLGGEDQGDEGESQENLQRAMSSQLYISEEEHLETAEEHGVEGQARGGVSFQACAIGGNARREEVSQETKKEGKRHRVNAEEEAQQVSQGKSTGEEENLQEDKMQGEEAGEFPINQDDENERRRKLSYSNSDEGYPTDINDGQVGNNISCICDTDQPDPLMLVCHFCSLAQHAACYRVLELSQVPLEHCCLPCSRIEGEESRSCTDPKLAKIADNPLAPSTCVYRRILAALIFMDEVSVDILVARLGLPRVSVEGIFNKLFSDQIVKEEDETEDGIYRVERDALYKPLKKYLGTKQNIVEAMIEKADRNNCGRNSVSKEKAASVIGDDTKKRKIDDEVKKNKKVKASGPISDLVI